MYRIFKIYFRCKIEPFQERKTTSLPTVVNLEEKEEASTKTQIKYDNETSETELKTVENEYPTEDIFELTTVEVTTNSEALETTESAFFNTLEEASTEVLDLNETEKITIKTLPESLTSTPVNHHVNIKETEVEPIDKSEFEKVKSGKEKFHGKSTEDEKSLKKIDKNNENAKSNVIINYVKSFRFRPIYCKSNEVFVSELHLCLPIDNCYPYPNCDNLPPLVKRIVKRNILNRMKK